MEITSQSIGPARVEPKPQSMNSAPLAQRPGLGSGGDAVELSLGQVEQIARALEHYTLSIGKELKFRIHEESDKLQVSVVDPKDNRVIRKIPPDEILALAVSIEKAVGLFLDRIL
jgi:uncharacterized FlaG/YvyC family protein